MWGGFVLITYAALALWFGWRPGDWDRLMRWLGLV
jgi:hypothetical protein